LVEIKNKLDDLKRKNPWAELAISSRAYRPFGNLITLLRHSTSQWGSCEYGLENGSLQIEWEMSKGSPRLEYRCFREETKVLGQRRAIVSGVPALETSIAVDPEQLLGKQIAFFCRGHQWRIQFLTSESDAIYELARLNRVLSNPRLFEARAPATERAQILSEAVARLSPPLRDCAVSDLPDDRPDVFDYRGWSFIWHEFVVHDEEVEGHIADLLALESEGLRADYLDDFQRSKVGAVLKILIGTGVVSGSPEEILEEQVVNCFLPRMREEGRTREWLGKRVELSKRRLARILDRPRENLRIRFRNLIRIAAVLGTPLFGISACPKEALSIKGNEGGLFGAPRGSAGHGQMIPPADFEI